MTSLLRAVSSQLSRLLCRLGCHVWAEPTTRGTVWCQACGHETKN